MSRIGKKPIEIPEGVQVAIEGSMVAVKGPKGELRQAIHPSVSVKKEGNALHVSVNNPEEKSERSLWGLFGSLLKNMITGVTKGFEKQLEINGIGFKAAVSGKKLVLNVGFSHPVEFPLPQGIEASVEKNVITIKGFDKYAVGETAARIRKIKKPEPYKGKGIKYVEETLRRKAGKAAGKGAE